MSIQEVLQGSRQWWIECADATDILTTLPDNCAKLVMIDPPWRYGAGRKGHGRATEHYDTLPMTTIAQHVAQSYRLTADPGYLMMWLTFPQIDEWFEKHSRTIRQAGWNYATGGAWGKVTGQGIGYYAWGDAEMWALYTRGKAVPPQETGKPSSLQIDPLLLTARFGRHSFKPAHFIDKAIECYTQPGDLVLDFYAGSSGMIAQMCQRLGRRYLGIEISESRRNEAMMRLSQHEMEMAV
jgi:hypothetical protein